MNRSKPAWWQLYLLGSSALGLSVLVHLWRVSETVRGAADFAIVLTTYGAINLWLMRNDEALEQEHTLREEARSGLAPAITEQQARYRHQMQVLHWRQVHSKTRKS